MTPPNNDRVTLYAMDPRRTPSDPFETPITDADGNVLPEAKQYRVPTATFLIDQDQVFWGDIQISATAANGDRGIVKSTHDLIGVKSYAYMPGNFNKAKLDNALNYMPDEGGTEIISLDFPGSVNEVTLILALLDNAQEQVQWQAFDEADNPIDGGILTTLDGTQIDALDSEELNFGEGTTYEFNLPTAGVSRLELSALADTGYSLAGIAYTPASAPLPDPVITSSDTTSVVENQTFAIDVEATDDIDAEGAGLTYVITGGTDAGLFDIDAASGVVTFTEAPDFEAPGDADTNNTYDLQVTVTDSDGLTGTQDIAIAVTDEPEGTPTPQAFLSIHSGKNAIRISTFAADSFVITNQSSDGLQIEQVIFDIGSSILPNLAFDPAGTAGDVVAGGLEIDSGAVNTGYVIPADNTVDPFSETFGNGGFTAMTLNFTDFDPGETVTFNVDVDPTNIEGDTGSGDAGSISGSELIGSTATLVFSDGSILTGEFFTDGSTSGSQTLVASTSAAPSLAVEVVDVDLAPDNNGFYTGTAAVGEAAQTVKVTGQPGQTVTLLQIEASGETGEIGGVPVTTLAPFETNAVVRADDQTAVLDANGEAFFQVTLTDTADPNQDISGVNLFAAAPVDGAGVVSGSVTEPIALQFDPQLSLPAVTLSVNTSVGSEADTTTITLTANTSIPVSGSQTVAIDLAGSGITANDFTGNLPSTLTFEDGATTASFTVAINDDALVEGTETATFSLSNPSAGLVLGNAVAQSVAIADNDTPPPSEADSFLLTLNQGTTLNGLETTTQDILLFNGANYSLFFQGADVGLTSAKINAFDVVSETEILLSFTDTIDVPGVGLVDDSDIVSFAATSLGETTSGTFSLYFDGSDVGLANGGEDIDALSKLPDGSLLISTLGNLNPGTGTIAAGEDLVQFAPTATGENTAGTFSLFLDGSDLGLELGAIDGLSTDEAGDFYFSLSNDFTLGGLSGTDEDIFSVTPTPSGEITSDGVASDLFFDGNQFGLSFRDLEALDRTFQNFGNPAELSLSINPTSISEDGTATATVTRTGDISTDLTVTLSNSDASAATVLDTVVIPAGQAAANFTIAAVDDAIADGPQTTTITATATGLTDAAASLEVTDNEIAALNLSLDANSIAENGGTATATVTRNTPTDAALTVSLSSSETSEAIVPATVVIPAGETFANFAVTAVDDAVVDGTQTATIEAIAAGLVNSSATLNITDNEVPALNLSIDASSIAENGGTATATVTRDGDLSTALTVDLSSSDTTAATVPTTVLFPAGQASATFIITAVNDALADGPQTPDYHSYCNRTHRCRSVLRGNR